MKTRLITSLAIVLVLIAALSLPAVAAEDEENITASVTVNEFINITLTGSISFGSVTPPVTDNGTVGQVDGSPAIKVDVGSETNVNVDIGIRGDAGGDTLTLDNWKYSTTFGGTKTSIPASYGTAVYSNVTAPSSNAFYHWITVPASTTQGDHSITVYYKAVTTGTSF